MATVDRVLGPKGIANGGVYQFAIPRTDVISDPGMTVPPAMGTAIAINFQPTGSGEAAITGDFVLLGKEVTPGLHALRENGIEVTAVHNHMLDDQPRTFFVHCEFRKGRNLGGLAVHKGIIVYHNVSYRE